MSSLVQLSTGQLEYLRRARFLPASLVSIIETARVARDEGCSLLISRRAAEDFRSTFTERLAEVGFGADYELSSEGQMLEELIDRFFGRVSK